MDVYRGRGGGEGYRDQWKRAAKNGVPDMFRVLAVNRVLVALKYVSLFAGARAGDEVTRDHGPVPPQPRGAHALYSSVVPRLTLPSFPRLDRSSRFPIDTSIDRSIAGSRFRIEDIEK